MLYKGMKISQIKDEGQLGSLVNVLELLSAKFDGLQKDHKKKDRKICELEKNIELLESI